jgi:hypothetical protein
MAVFQDLFDADAHAVSAVYGRVPRSLIDRGNFS